jgi:hypothetical protein
VSNDSLTSMSLRSRYLMSVSVVDDSGQLWLQAFNDVGLLLMGMPASKLHEMKVRPFYPTHRERQLTRSCRRTTQTENSLLL